ncbi:ankyrin-2-like [Mytilus californianus]|uniref:ankyrin-2-like n=1 Tax=Mytilus californianus TaxID=6549 RepID=UPI00224639AF|nr:ankyrin-2-like [Mytilus californianus]
MTYLGNTSMTSLSKDETNFLRLAHLIIRISPRAVRTRFNHHFNPGGLHIVLNREKSKINKLFCKRILSQLQMNILFSSSGLVKSEHMDITLMICLLRNIAKLKIHDVLPNCLDISEEADLSRIKYYRNDFVHATEGIIDDNSFTNVWNEVSEAVIRLGGKALKDECDSLLVGELDRSYRDVYLQQICKENRLEEVEEKLKKLEIKISEYTRDDKEEEFEEWRKENEKFVTTTAVTAILDIIKKKSFTVLTGSQGIGKSAIARHLCILLKDTEKFIVITGLQPSDIIKSVKKDNNQIFLVDDLCGNFLPDQNELNIWIRLEKKINGFLKSQSCKIIATCRLQIWNSKPFERFKEYFATTECNLSSEHFAISTEEKRSIAESYLGKAVLREISDEVMNKAEMFPLLCSIYSNSKHKNVYEFFLCPYEVFERELNEMQHFNGGCTVGLALLVVLNNNINKNLFFDALSSETNNMFDSLFEDCNVSHKFTRSHILSCLLSLEGTFIKESAKTIATRHDRIFDIISLYFGRQIISSILHYGNRNFVRKRIQFESIKEEHNKFTILLPVNKEDLYFKNLHSDILQRKFLNLFSIYQIKYESFQRKLLSFISKHTNTVKLLTSNRWPLYLCAWFDVRTVANFLMAKQTNNTKSDIIVSETVETSDRYAMTCDDALDETLMSFITLGQRKIQSIQSDHNIYNNMEDYNEISCEKVNEENADSTDNEDLTEYYKRKGLNVFFEYLKVNNAPLMVCCALGHLYLTELFIKYFDINTPDMFGNSPLVLAVSQNQYDITKLLIRKGAVINEFEDQQNCPLFQACALGYLHIVELLLDNGAESNTCLKGDAFPLIIACEMGHGTVVDVLLKYSTNVNHQIKEGLSEGNTALYVASRNGYTPIVKCLLLAGADVNLANTRGQTPLFISSLKGHLEIVELLLHYNCNINKLDDIGGSPFYFSCQNSHIDICKLLLRQTAKPDINIRPHNFGHTPLIVSSFKGDLQLVNVLLQHDCDVNLQDKGLRSALHYAVFKNHNNIVRILLENSIDVNLLDSQQKSALLYACEKGHTDIVQLLLDIRCVSNTVFQCDINQGNKIGTLPLWVACFKGYTEIVKMLLQQNCEVNKLDEKGGSSFYIACQNNHIDICNLLMEHHVQLDINISLNDLGYTPLIIASFKGNIAVVELLLKNKCDVNLCDKENRSALFCAVRGNQIKIVELLLDHDADFTLCDVNQRNVLHVASMYGFTDILKLLLTYASDIDAYDSHQQTALHFAVKKGHEDTVKELLERNCNPNLCNDECQSPLHTASYFGYANLVKILLEYNCKVYIRDEYKRTALHRAVEKENKEVVQIFLQSNFDVNISDYYRGSALHIAILENYEDVVDLLLQCSRCDINLQNEELKTPLFIACEHGKMNLVKLLLKKTKTPDIPNISGQTPLFISCYKGYSEIVQMLVQEGSSTSLKDKQGRSPFHVACQYNHVQTVRMLLSLEEKPDVNSQSNSGQTPLMTAIQYGHNDIIYALLKSECDINIKDSQQRTALYYLGNVTKYFFSIYFQLICNLIEMITMKEK